MECTWKAQVIMKTKVDDWSGVPWKTSHPHQQMNLEVASGNLNNIPYVGTCIDKMHHAVVDGV